VIILVIHNVVYRGNFEINQYENKKIYFKEIFSVCYVFLEAAVFFTEYPRFN